MQSIRHWVGIFGFLVCSSVALSHANAAEANDAYLTGYIQYILEQEMYWTDDEYKLDVSQGNVILAMTEPSPIKRADAINRIYEVPGIKDVEIIIAKGIASNAVGSTPKLIPMD